MLYKNLVEALYENRSREKEITFIETSEIRSILSYVDLYDRARNTLFHLQHRGLLPGDEVILQTGDNQEFLIIFWACLMGKFIPVPVTEATNDEYTLKLFNIQSILRNPHLAIDREKLQRLETFASEQNREAQFEKLSRRTLHIPELLNGGEQGKIESIDGSDIAYIQFSSGSTGNPKGVVLKHLNLLTNINGIVHGFGNSQQGTTDHCFSWMPLTHDMGLIGFHLTPLVAGWIQTLMLPSLFIRYPRLWLEKLAEYEATITVSPNFGYQYVLKHAGRLAEDPIDLSSIRIMVNGAEPISADLCERFTKFAAPFKFKKEAMFPAYGMAEASLAICTARPHEKWRTYKLDRNANRTGVKVVEINGGRDATEFVEIGFPVKGCLIKIVDLDGGELGEETTGEIAIKGDNVTSGYYNDVEATAAAFIDDGWFLTGDLGFVKNGRLVVTGRKKEIIFVNGLNYYPHDLERAAEEMEEIDFEKVVFCGASNPESGTDEIIGFVVFKKSLEEFLPLAEALTNHMARRLGIVVHHVVPIKKVPKTTSGKIKRNSLKDHYSEGRFGQEIQELDRLRRESAASGDDYSKDELQVVIRSVWATVLSNETIADDRNFFEAGGNSTAAVMAKERLQTALRREIDVIDIFRFPTIATLASYLAGEAAVEATKELPAACLRPEAKIAVIGMACRFPGARTTDEFWLNLAAGRDSLTKFSDGELLEAGIVPVCIEDPFYVKVKGIVEDCDCFDADFFGYTPAEAAAMDPQTRILHELAWETLESAGCDPAEFEGLIGLYAGASPNLHWQFQSAPGSSNRASSAFTSVQLHDKDFMCTRVSYKLDLKGPSVTLYSACSTSLVAVDAACQGLLTGRCDLALAGGVSIWLPQKTGYHYEEGMLFSKSGRCRSFDSGADGTIFSDGGGLVALMRLDEAIARKDPVQAVILASFTNNDGSQKAGYTAPGIDGQAAVIRHAMRMAGIDAESVSYIETHGSATQLGDSIELQAMHMAFAAEKRRYCAVGSVKSNLGHLNAAAGIAGLIKTVLALKNRLVPPSIHFKNPNPLLASNDTPFYINNTLSPWKNDDAPLRAGVSAFGIGGTNAHVVLEDAPLPESRVAGPAYAILPLSGKTPQAVGRAAAGLRKHLEAHPRLNLTDAAFTLQTGRRHFHYRDAAVCASREEALASLTKIESAERHERVLAGGLPVVFMFSGLGAHYTDMGQGLYASSPVFREETDRCVEILRTLTDINPAKTLDDPLRAHIAMFTFQYALARLLMSWGVQPEAMIGYSFGEYAAACLSGMLSLDEALRIVVARGRALGSQPAGKMASVPLDRDSLLPYLHDNIYIAIDNGPSCVVAGAPEAIDAFSAGLKSERYLSVEFPSTHAMHSPLMNGMTAEFAAALATATIKPPRIKTVSNVTGTWFENRDMSSLYWNAHLTGTVRFADGISAILKQGPACFVEIGPGHDLRLLVERRFGENSPNRALNLVRPANQAHEDTRYLMKRLALLWKYGASIDWRAVHKPAEPVKVPLPTYPFEKTVFDISIQKQHEADSSGDRGRLAKKRDIADWFYIPGWKRTLGPLFSGGQTVEPQRWFILGGDDYLETHLRNKLQTLGHTVISIPSSDRLNDLLAGGTIPNHIVHCRCAGDFDGNGESTFDEIETHLYKGFYSLVTAASALERAGIGQTVIIWVITSGVYPVTGTEKLSPVRATITAPLKTLPQEFPFIQCRHIDLEHGVANDPRFSEQAAELAIAEFLAGGDEAFIAYRSQNRWVQRFEPARMERTGRAPRYLKKGGVYLVTGGTGNIGFALSRFLAEATHGTLVLTGRTPVPAGDGSAAGKAGKIRELEKLGATVLYHQADAANLAEMQAVIDGTLSRYGALDGVIHAAGVMDKTILSTAAAIKPQDWRLQFPPKVLGISVLENVLGDLPLDFVLVTSSLSPLLGGIGLSVYAAANVYMDTFVHRHNRNHPVRWTTVNWADWEFSRDPAIPADDSTLAALFANSEMNIPIEDGIDTFERILSRCEESQIIVSAGDLDTRIRRWITNRTFETDEQTGPIENRRKPRPDVMTSYSPPANDLQRALTENWAEIFGIEDIGVDDDFFELGGDSLKALSFISRLHRESKLLIEVADFFKHPTIRGLTAILEQRDTGDRDDIVPGEKQEYYDLSHSQKGLWVLDQLAENLVAYNLSSAVEFGPDLDPDALEEAYKLVVQRHESLRTIFTLKDGEPKQKVVSLEESGFAVKRVDLRRHPEPRLEAERLAAADKQVPFHLQKGPLIRVTLVTLPDGYIKLFAVHHIICDGLSLNIVIRDWLDYYRRLAAGEHPLHPAPLRLQYRDFCRWHNQQLRHARIDRHREYWLDTMSGELPVLELPVDFARPEIKTYSGSSLTFELDRETAIAIPELGRLHQSSLFMVILAAVNTLLHGYSGQRDIILGAVTAGRDYGHLDDQIGFYANTLPIRSSVDPEESFETFLHGVRDNLLRAYQHQIFPFAMIVESLGPNTPPSRNPLFDVIVVLQNIDVQDESAEGDRMIFTGNRGQWASSSFDLTFSFYSDRMRDCFTIRYNTDLFEEATIQLMGQRLIDLFSNIVKNPISAVGQLAAAQPTETAGEKVVTWEIDF